MKTTIGFIGLGNMGINMAKNLIAAGHHLKVHNRTASRAEELDKAFITVCKTPAEAAKEVGIVITMLSDDEVVKETVLGDDGILKTLKKDGIHLSMSTISPETSVELAEQHKAAGSIYLASPVFGRPEAAAAKKLWICVSGESKAKEAVKPVLEKMGQGIFDFGDAPGGANVVKVAGNFMIMACLEMMAEAYTMAEKNGLDRMKVAEFFSSTLFNIPVFKGYGDVIAKKEYGNVGFKAKLGYKDARLAFKLSQTSEAPMPIATTVHNRLLSAVAKGWGDKDWAEGIARGVSEEAGT